MQVRDASNVSRVVAGISVRAGGSQRAVRQAFVRDAGNILRAVFNSLTGSASPDFVTGTGYSAGAITVTTAATSVTILGGYSPFTHAWTSPDSGWSATAPTGAVTAFRKTSLGPGDDETTTFTDTITDATGATTTVTVTAEASNSY